jgi:hypothetical protein
MRSGQVLKMAFGEGFQGGCGKGLLGGIGISYVGFLNTVVTEKSWMWDAGMGAI